MQISLLTIKIWKTQPISRHGWGPWFLKSHMRVLVFPEEVAGKVRSLILVTHLLKSK